MRVKNFFNPKELELKLQETFNDPAFIEFADSAPCIIGYYNFREGCYMFISQHVTPELGYVPEELVGTENTEFAMNAIFPDHGELWFFKAIPKVMEFYIAAGSREETMKISYSICVQLLTRDGEKKMVFILKQIYWMRMRMVLLSSLSSI